MGPAVKHLGNGVGTVWVRAQKGGDMVSFAEGDDIPAWASKQMGDHCFEDVDGTPSEDDVPEVPETPAESVYAGFDKEMLEAEVAKRNEVRADDSKIVVAADATADDVAALLDADDAS